MHADVLTRLLRDREIHVRTFLEQGAEYASVTTPLHPHLQERLSERGIAPLFTHQAEAFDHAARGDDLMVVSGTGSGKTLCYNLPVLQACLTEPRARALYLYPTKALAHDQLGKLEDLAAGMSVLCATYDGDTPAKSRSAVRKQANIVLSNPDMVHVGILPNHTNWSNFLRSLRYVVVDEAHVYKGVFGGHVGWVLRRLLRLADWYGGRPQVIAASATLRDPDAVFNRLTGRSAKVVASDGAPKGEKTVVVVAAPPDEGSTDPPSPNVETAKLLAESVEHKAKIMAFCRSRSTTERVVRIARDVLEKKGLSTELVDSYRGGYTAEDRREIEKRLFQGHLAGLATTNAMELGVDVGGLDVVVMNGYPGSVASFWQQSGRAGRAGRPGLSLMIAHDDPLEQYLARNPAHLFDQQVEPSIASVWNRHIVSAQLACAAFERPIDQETLESWGEEALTTALQMVEEDRLRESAGLLVYPRYENPALETNIRGGDSKTVTLFSDGDVLGEMEYWRALQSAHEGAVYLHRGETYLSAKLDLTTRQCIMERADVDYTTQPIVQSVVEPVVTVESRESAAVTVGFWAVQVTTVVAAYRRMTLATQQILDETSLTLPPISYDTLALRVDLQGYTPGDLEVTTAVHGLEHVLSAIAPMVAGCDRRDLGSAWYALSPDSFTPTVYLFDGSPGGVGLCEELFRQFDQLVDRAAELLSSCPCSTGCPLCLMMPQCESGNELLDKKATQKVLASILAGLNDSL